jgi:hypothetical protein
MSDLRIIHGTANGCSACRRQLGSLKAFDAHQVHRDGVFTGQCIDPAELGLIQDSNGVWVSPERLASNQRCAAQLQTARSGRRTVAAGASGPQDG